MYGVTKINKNQMKKSFEWMQQGNNISLNEENMSVNINENKSE